MFEFFQQLSWAWPPNKSFWIDLVGIFHYLQARKGVRK